MSKPNIEQAVATPFESIELSGVVTVGEESAKLLSEKLGRKVEPGETFDLGTLAYFHRDRKKRFLANLELSRKKTIFS